MTSLFFDILMVGLLLTAIVFCYRLNIRLKMMRKMGAELSPFMSNMSNYLEQISQSIEKLKHVADLGNQGLNEHIPMAINLKDDFDLLLEHSDKMAQRLDEVIDKAREIDQRLQQTMRIVESARSSNHSPEPTLQKTIDRSRQNTAPRQTPFTKDRFLHQSSRETSHSFSIPPLELEENEVDYFTPSQSKHRDENKLNSKKEQEVNQKRSPIERGIMAKLRGLR